MIGKELELLACLKINFKAPNSAQRNKHLSTMRIHVCYPIAVAPGFIANIYIHICIYICIYIYNTYTLTYVYIYILLTPLSRGHVKKQKKQKKRKNKKTTRPRWV